jgi:putative redox protein
MEMRIDFPGGARVDAHFDSYTVATDQLPAAGGQASAPSPFQVFLASMGTCAGIYVLTFCRQRGLATQGIHLIQKVTMDPATNLAQKISIEIRLPEDFPEKYKAAVIRAAEQCKVKKHFEHPPLIEVTTT